MPRSLNGARKPPESSILVFSFSAKTGTQEAPIKFIFGIFIIWPPNGPRRPQTVEFMLFRASTTELTLELLRKLILSWTAKWIPELPRNFVLRIYMPRSRSASVQTASSKLILRFCTVWPPNGRRRPHTKFNLRFFVKRLCRTTQVRICTTKQYTDSIEVHIFTTHLNPFKLIPKWNQEAPTTFHSSIFVPRSRNAPGKQP